MKFKVPEGVASVSLGGIEYRAVDGAVEAAAAYADELAYHGCVPWPDPDPAATAAARPVPPRHRRPKE